MTLKHQGIVHGPLQLVKAPKNLNDDRREGAGGKDKMTPDLA